MASPSDSAYQWTKGPQAPRDFSLSPFSAMSAWYISSSLSILRLMRLFSLSFSSNWMCIAAISAAYFFRRISTSSNA